MPPILQQLKDYFKTRFELLKLEAIDDATAIIAGLIADLVILSCLGLAFVFFTIALAFFLAAVFKSLWLGFCTVAAIYVVLAFLSHWLKRFFQTKLISLFISKLIKK